MLGIITLLLFFTVITCIIVVAIDTLEAFLLSSMLNIYISGGVVLLIGTCLNCFYQFFRPFPRNYVLLGLFTVAQAYMIGSAAVRFETHIVLLAVIASLLMFIWLTIYSVIFASDFTIGKGGAFTVFLMIIYFMATQFFYAGSIVNLGIICLAVCFLNIWIIYDAKRITGESKQYNALTLDDFCLGVMILYFDTITFFFFIIHIFACRSGLSNQGEGDKKRNKRGKRTYE